MAPRKTLSDETVDAVETDVISEVKKTPAQLKAEQDAWLNEKVPFYAFKDAGQYRDDIVVWVNDDYCKIQRGKHVMVKRKFMLALEASARQKQVAAEVQDGYADTFENEVKPFMA